jgi:hypothetical protein
LILKFQFPKTNQVVAGQDLALDKIAHLSSPAQAANTWQEIHIKGLCKMSNRFNE